MTWRSSSTTRSTASTFFIILDPDSTVPASLPTDFQGRYRIERELGHGGMATVFLAQDVSTPGRWR